MLEIIDKQEQTVAHIEKNIIIDAKTNKVTGIMLGHCVYNVNAKLICKAFNNAFHDLNGTILGFMKATDKHLSFPAKELSDQAWTILMKTKNNAGAWIPSLSNWSDKTLSLLLSDSTEN